LGLSQVMAFSLSPSAKVPRGSARVVPNNN